jgi:hypothetical protein
VRESEKEKTRFSLLRAEITIGDYTTTKTKPLRDQERTRPRTNLIQLKASLETDKDGDSGRAKGKQLSRT